MPIGVIAALPAEARAWARLRAGGRLTDADGHRIALAGMGSERSAAVARQLVADGVDALVSWGSAAGLDPALAAGTLTLPSVIVDADGRRQSVNRRWRECVIDRLPSGTVPRGELTLAQTPSILADAASKKSLRVATGASVADMETAAVAAVARDAGVAFLAVRAVTDDAYTHLPPAAVAAVAQTGRSTPVALATALLRQPRQLHAQLRALKQLSTGFARAQSQLAAARPIVIQCAELDY